MRELSLWRNIWVKVLLLNNISLFVLEVELTFTLFTLPGHITFHLNHATSEFVSE